MVASVDSLSLVMGMAVHSLGVTGMSARPYQWFGRVRVSSRYVGPVRGSQAMQTVFRQGFGASLWGGKLDPSLHVAAVYI